ncbi:MAG: hypothetical protein KGI37_10985, partial [Alphaproteobacteria bacterium]|nr:hypothetical protein [Alphaproteobacteria bacterium]
PAAFAAFASFCCYSSSPGTQAWYTLPIGGGGNLLHMSVQNDGTDPQAMVVTTDTCGAYIWNPSATAPNGATGAWQPLVNAGAMPASYVSAGPALCAGVYALSVAPSATQTMYMAYQAYVANASPDVQGVYKTTNGGANWTLTNFNGSSSPNPININPYFGDTSTSPGGALKNWGPRIAIDPSTPNNVIVSTGTALYYTTNGGTSWTTNSTIPAAIADGNGNYPGYIGLAISKFNTNHVFAFSYGNGLYESTTGVGGTFSKINGTSGCQTIVYDAKVDPNTGFYYCVEYTGHVWQWNDTSSTWTEVYSGTGVQAVAIDPNTANHIVIGTGNGQLAESTNGTSFGTLSGQQTTATGDVTWLGPFTANVQELWFDPVTAKKLYATSNRAFFTTTYTGTISNTTTINWQLQTRGIEQLVAIRTIVPSSNKPLVLSWDTALTAPAFNSYPSSNPVRPPPASATSLAAGQSIDWCSSNRSDVVMIANSAQYSQTDYSGYSTDGGVNWTNFGAEPPNAGTSGGGTIACASATDAIWAPGGAVQPYHTTNYNSATPTWTTISLFPGMTAWSQFNGGGTHGMVSFCADRGTPGTYYSFWNSTFFKSTDGVTFTSLGSPGTILTGETSAIKCTDGVSGDFWFTPNDNAPNESLPCGNAFYHYNGTSIITVTNAECVVAFGFGVSSTGSGYPALYIEGYVNVSGTWTFGVWRSDNAGTAGATPTWTQIGSTGGYPGGGPNGYPAGTMSLGFDMSGDPSVYGQAYLCTGGAACMVYR